ncbi:hypothetical protein [uncultured Sulfitobacter sp.]|uniref:hypothetical protein n=1 Tax=uncultured Sulfitobacter sp. TaxID=191468 RepID=UPI0030DCFC7C
MTHRTPRSTFCKTLASAFVFAAFIVPSSAFAQDVTFQIDNFVSLEQIIAQQAYVTSTGATPMDNSVQAAGSTSSIVQQGTANFAQSFSANSSNAVIGIAQAGNDNTSIAVIVDSPDSAIAQLQLGNSNSSVVGIIGGSDNGVSTLQLGNNLGVSVALVDSTGTKVVYGQAGNDYNGGVVIKNAPVGTVIKLN